MSLREAGFLFGLFWAQFILGAVVPESLHGGRADRRRHRLPGAGDVGADRRSGTAPAAVPRRIQSLVRRAGRRTGRGRTGRGAELIRRRPRRGTPVAWAAWTPARSSTSSPPIPRSRPRSSHVRELPGARRRRPSPSPTICPSCWSSGSACSGIEGLYPHQARGLEALRAGRNLMHRDRHREREDPRLQRRVRRGRPQHVRKPRRCTCIPTKALARDQLRAVRALKLPQVKAAVYDGDTPKAERPLIRKNANLVMTNPDMLHLSLLPDHARWADFFFRLSIVVVDEAHVCRGVFGSHVAMVLRRLRRLVAHYGGEPALVSRERHGRQPGRARGAPHRPGRRRDRRATRRRGREALRPVEPADRRRGHRAAAERADRGVVAHGRARRATASARSGSRGRGGPPSCSRSSPGGRWATRRLRDTDQGLPRRLPGGGPPADRAAARRRRAARRRLDERARAGHRHRLARRRRADRLPGHARLDVAAGRARRAARRPTRSRSSSPRTTRSTSTSCTTPTTSSTSRPRRP